MLADRKEIFKTMMLQTGARVSAWRLRVRCPLFACRLQRYHHGGRHWRRIEIVCQGDGLNCRTSFPVRKRIRTRTCSSSMNLPNDIGRLLTSKGNWIKDFISGTSKAGNTSRKARWELRISGLRSNRRQVTFRFRANMARRCRTSTHRTDNSRKNNGVTQTIRKSAPSK